MAQSKLVVVGDLYVFRSFLGPDEAHPELIVDPDRMLSITIPAQSLKPISRRRAQVIQVNRSVTAGKPFGRSPWQTASVTQPLIIANSASRRLAEFVPSYKFVFPKYNL